MQQSQNISVVNVRESLRRHVCKTLVELNLHRVIAYQRPKVNQHLLPAYVVEFPPNFTSEQTRYLMPLSLRHKGKRRVYCDAGFARSKHAISMSYLGKKSLLALRPQVQFIKSYLDKIGNRWVITIGKPVAELKSIQHILNHLIGVQPVESRVNHPVMDDGVESWTLFGNAAKYLVGNAHDTEMLCKVQKYKK